MKLTLTVQLERGVDGRWIAEVVERPGALAYGASTEAATAPPAGRRCRPRARRRRARGRGRGPRAAAGGAAPGLGGGLPPRASSPLPRRGGAAPHPIKNSFDKPPSQ